MTCWTRIDHGTAVGVRSGHGRSLHRHSDVNSRRPSRCLRNPAGRCAKHSPRTLASACVWFKYGSRISARRWRSFSGRPRRSPDPIKSPRKSGGRKARTAITVSGLFHPIIREFPLFFLTYARLLLDSWSWNSLQIPNVKLRKHCYFYALLSLVPTLIPTNFNDFCLILSYSSYLVFSKSHVE